MIDPSLEEGMQANEIKAIARRFVEEAWNEGALEVIDELYTPDCMMNDRPLGAEGIKQFIGMFRSAFPDLHLTVEEQFVDRDRHIMRTRSQGTNHGSFMGIPPSGKAINIGAISISRFEGAKVAEEWEYNDGLGLYRQLGLLPARGKGPG
jgi:steroid delta-isomerase-like uncharacterized protein